jgi:hypothetical protein
MRIRIFGAALLALRGPGFRHFNIGEKYEAC